MFALMPWTRRSAMVPRTEPDELGSLVNRLLNEPFLTNWPMIEPLQGPNWWGLTTEENDKEFLVRMELPGFEPAEVTVDVIGDRLAVEAEHKEPEAADEAAAKRTNGRTFAHVRRSITLPPNLDLERVEATYRNGVLEIRLPRTPEANGRRIEVKT